MHNFSQISLTSCQFSVSADDLASLFFFFFESRRSQKITLWISSTASAHWLRLPSNTHTFRSVSDDWSVLLSKASSFTYALDPSLFTSQGHSSRNAPCSPTGSFFPLSTGSFLLACRHSIIFSFYLKDSFLISLSLHVSICTFSKTL